MDWCGFSKTGKKQYFMSPALASMFLYDSFYVVDQMGSSSGEIR